MTALPNQGTVPLTPGQERVLAIVREHGGAWVSWAEVIALYNERHPRAANFKIGMLGVSSRGGRSASTSRMVRTLVKRRVLESDLWGQRVREVR